ncbi:hypothetical protein [Ghiorsea bivora]|uniref:hypothetical protein n=1 Tax=Ghiorsea bivora TaxID=1485545 RepID=UPI00068CAEEC|nr:hypothetical protein [Ghiorsea bivora]
MAIPVSPSSGFITRLLQQTSQQSTAATRATANRNMPKTDASFISAEARHAYKNDNQQLENKLIELYNQKGQGQR